VEDVLSDGGKKERMGSDKPVASEDRGLEEASPHREDGSLQPTGMDRRDFLRRSGAGAGALALTGSLGGFLSGCGSSATAAATPSVAAPGTGPEVVVIGAGAFGVWTAYHLQEMGARVTLVDLYGAGNSRSTSGDETRGVRSSYAGRELWTEWANLAMERWREFDEEWSPAMGDPLFYTTGDLILRDTTEGQIEEVREVWDTVGVPYEVLSPDEVRSRWPQIQIEGIEAALYEPGAGVVRSRAACRRVAGIFQQRGGQIRIAKARPGPVEGGRMVSLDLDDGADSISADRYVFALGPWFPKAFPEIMADRLRITTMGHVFYFGTPPGDYRFSYPNLPSWGFPGVTGWPTLPPDNRGFRIRTGGRVGEDPDTSVRWIPEEFHERPMEILQERFPIIAQQPIVETRACHYESSATRDWIIDDHPEMENVLLAGGGSAEGFKFGPMVGELIASRALMDGRFVDLDDRFRLAELELNEEED
jgi:sarcosine oxidase